MMRFLSSRLMAGVLTLFLVAPACAGIAVVGNHSLQVSAATLDELERLYLGKTNNLGSESFVIPIDQSVGSKSRDLFYSRIVKMSETQSKSYWARVIFTGKGQPPQQETGDGAVKELVSHNANFIGYIDSNAVDGSVKVLFRID